MGSRRIPIASLGVHPMNRGGVYPQPEVVKGLALEILRLGFNRAEADHEGVCVEEVPLLEQKHAPLHRASPYVSYGEWNRSHCETSALLKTCFCSGDVLYGTLSHSHLLLTLRCWVTGAQWDLADQQVCDGQGRLDLAAVAARDGELAAATREGLQMEVLSWKMYVEEPGACSVISQALNIGHQVALKTTELTALAVLTGAVGQEMERQTANKVAFETVKERVRADLDVLVDEPDFMDLFEFVIHLGADKNSYIPGLLTFGSKFVDQKKRRLRLQAFAVANKMPTHCPLSKVACIKRAYRKDPQKGYCPNPEAAWGNLDPEPLEELLQYLHGSLNDAVAAVRTSTPEKQQAWLVAFPAEKQLAWLANVDVSSADAFVRSTNVETRRRELLEATNKYFEELKAAYSAIEMDLPSGPGPTTSGFTFASLKGTAKNKSKLAAEQSAILPQVITFDERRGLAQGAQGTRDADANAKTTDAISLPWREWCASEFAQQLTGDATMISAAVAVMSLLHSQHPLWASEPIDIMLLEESKQKSVVATKDIEAFALQLPPCAPKSSKILQLSSHPWRVPVRVMKKTTPVDTNATAKTFYINPEWEMPSEADHGDMERPPQLRLWTWTGSESMHPFWAVRRATPSQMAVIKATKKDAEVEPRFNCIMPENAFSTVALGSINKESCAETYTVYVPMLTNTVVIKGGEELFLEISEPKPAARKAETWKDDVAKKAKKEAAADAKKAPEVKKKGGLRLVEDEV